MTKPIIRWVIGPTSPQGLHCLHLSVKTMKKLYGDTFQYLICYNNIPENILPPNMILINQHQYEDSLPIPPINHPSWKFYPPRLDINTHEIIIDNDIMLYKRPPLIDEFIKSDFFITTESFYPNQYNSIAKTNLNFDINTGIVGLPPFFDYKKEILPHLPTNWSDHLDEHMIIAFVLSKLPTKLISKTEIHICAESYQKGTYGIHFINLNRGKTDFWYKYIADQLYIFI